MDESKKKGAQAVTGIERILDAIELLVDHPLGISLSEIARRLPLAKSATHRLLALLVRRGYVQRPFGRDDYRLSMKLAALGFRHVAQTGMLDICQPVLDRLAERVGELVLMTLFEDGDLTFVAKAQGGRRGLRYDADLGWEAVLHATATGRAWLMTMTDEEAIALVEANGFGVPDRYGNEKVKNADDLVAELARARQRGYVFSIDEGEDGAACVSVAIPAGMHGRSPGAVSVAGSVRRITNALEEIVPDLTAAAAEIGALWPILDSRVIRGS